MTSLYPWLLLNMSVIGSIVSNIDYVYQNTCLARASWCRDQAHALHTPRFAMPSPVRHTALLRPLEKPPLTPHQFRIALENELDPLIGLLATTVFGLLYRSYNQKVWK